MNFAKQQRTILQERQFSGKTSKAERIVTGQESLSRLLEQLNTSPGLAQESTVLRNNSKEWMDARVEELSYYNHVRRKEQEFGQAQLIMFKKLLMMGIMSA